VKEAQEGLGPWAFSAGRFALAALAFSPCLPTAISSSRTLRAGAELGAIAAAGYACQAWGLQSTSASHTSFLGSFTVLLVPFLAGLTGRTIPLRTWAATGVALLGICALELGGVDAGGGHQAMLQLGGFSLPASACGDAASLVSAALFALQLLRTEHHCSKLGEGGAPFLISAQLTTLALIFGALTVAVPTPAMDALLRNADGPQALLTALPLKEWLLTGVVSTAGALWAELEALREVSAPDAALVYATEPVWGAVTAFFLLGERWTGSTWLGAALILSGSLYGQKMEEGDGEKEAS
jgi:drug/metabolite transporter (DMT)-like permease